MGCRKLSYYQEGEGLENCSVFFGKTLEKKGGQQIFCLNYYPFGGTFNSYTSGTKNNYLYGGKELQEETQVYDFEARMYDPWLGRFNSVDPLADITEFLTPYHYVRNNPMIRVDPTGLTDYTLNKKTGEINEVTYDNEDEQKANDAAETDRVVKTDKDGNIKRNRKGVVKTTNVKDIEKGILKDGINFQEDNNIIEVGGEGQPTVEGFEDFALKMSNHVNKEIGGFYASQKGQDKISYVYTGKYANNTDQKALAGFNLKSAGRMDLFGKVDVRVDFHTHLSRFGDSDRLRPSSLGPQGGDEGYKKRHSKNNPNLKFIIITNPKTFEY